MRHDEYDDEPSVVIEKHSGSVGSFLVGLAVGAGLALLMAPQSGEATRQQIRRRARDAGDRARGYADDLQREAREQVGRARGVVTDRVDRARDAIDMKRAQVQRAVEAGRVAAAQAREDLERRIAETKAAYQAGGESYREGRPGRRAGATVGAADVTGVDPLVVAPGHEGGDDQA